MKERKENLVRSLNRAKNLKFLHQLLFLLGMTTLAVIGLAGMVHLPLVGMRVIMKVITSTWRGKEIISSATFSSCSRFHTS